MAADDALQDWTVTEDDDPFLMANLFPRDTGLPMSIWISERGRARHDVRVKVNLVHGPRGLGSEYAVIGVRPEPRLIHGDLPGNEVEAVAAWIRLNHDVIMDYWNSRISTLDLGRRLQRLPD